jgi:hypothetical protein
LTELGANDDPPFTVHVAAGAAKRINAGGGRLFLWNRAVGKSGIRDFLSFRPPPDVEFECYYHAKRGVQLCVALQLNPKEIIVRARRWPFSGVRVCVDGKRWGWRGDSVPTVGP